MGKDKGQKHSGKLFRGQKKEEKAEQTVDPFWDDENLSVNEAGVREHNTKHGTSLHLESASKQAYQAYARYLYISGGKLALHKCKLYWITFVRRSRRYYFSTRAPKKFLFGERFKTRRVKLKQLQANESHKILRMKIVPTGSKNTR